MILIFAMMLVGSYGDNILLSKSYENCISTGDAGEGVQSAMQECIDREFSVQDGRLNQAYKMKMLSLPGDKKLILRGMQRQWIKDRDRRCEAEGEGSLDRFIADQCLTLETQKRTRWLELYK